MSVRRRSAGAAWAPGLHRAEAQPSHGLWPGLQSGRTHPRSAQQHGLDAPLLGCDGAAGRASSSPAL